MNENNLDYLKNELEALQFPKSLQEALELKLQKQLPEFELRHRTSVDRGQLDYTLHFRKSNQSDFYFFNKYEVSLSTLAPPEQGQKYMVITAHPDTGKFSHKTFQDQLEAIKHFKSLNGTHELATGQNLKNRIVLAGMEEGKVTFVKEDYRQTFFHPSLTHTFYIDKGKGFTALQAANLLQGRSVFREDFVGLDGHTYQAWAKLDFDQPKDQRGNFVLAQYHHPAYGFELEKTLEKFAIRELDNPATREALLDSLKQGERPFVTALKEGQEKEVILEAAPRFKNINFYDSGGTKEKREEFERKSLVEPSLNQDKGQIQNDIQSLTI
jgi:hypothetical protein